VNAPLTCRDYIGRLLEDDGIKPSWDGRGRWIDNVFVERFWRSFKPECVYLHDRSAVVKARRGLGDYFAFHNHSRPNSLLDNQPPAAVHFQRP